MSEQEKSIVEEYCKKMDERHSKLMNVIYALILAFIGAGAIQFVSFGEVKAQAKETAAKVDFINQNYVPTLFLEGMLQNYMFYTQEMVAKVTGDKGELKEVGEKYIMFQSEMVKQMIQSRGGISSQTRGSKKSSK